jgi:hypothetical protein
LASITKTGETNPFAAAFGGVHSNRASRWLGPETLLYVHMNIMMRGNILNLEI